MLSRSISTCRCSTRIVFIHEIIDGAVDGTAIKVETKTENFDKFASGFVIVAISVENNHDNSLHKEKVTFATIKIMVII